MSMLLEEMVKAVEMWLKMRRTSQLEPEKKIDPNLDPVLLVPGIAGSILKAVDTENGRDERVWIRILRADHELRTKLWSQFDPSTGRTVSLNQNTSIMVPEDRYGLYAIDTLDPDLILGREYVYYFHDMIVEMIKWGFEEGKTLFGFGYDFRQSNRLQDTMKRFAEKLESVYEASGGKKINIISHSMGGLLVKCFMCLHSDIFEKYVQNWIAIAAPFRGAPGYVTSSFLNGMSFVEGWEQNFFISKWSMHQLLIECPSIYELMPCPDFNWLHPPMLELWREKQDSEGNSRPVLESYGPNESIDVFNEALSNNTVEYDGKVIPMPFNLEILKWANETHKLLSNAKLPSQVKFYNIYATNLDTPHSVCYGTEDTPVTDFQELRFFQPSYICVDGDGTVPTESAKADGLKAEARVGVPGEHRGILSDHHVFRILKHWLKADSDPFYNPLNDYVIIPEVFEMESRQEEWEIVSADDDAETISTAQGGNNHSSRAEARGNLMVRSQNEGKQHVQLNAISVSVDV